MIEVRSPSLSDADGVARAWDDARELYVAMDPRVFLPPVPDDDGLGPALVGWLIDTDARPNGMARVATQDGHAVGFITATLFERMPDAHREIIRDATRRHVKIDTLVVQKSHWRRGVGRTLVGHVERWADDVEATLVKVGTYAHNDQALSFYERLGYANRSVIFEKYLD